MSLAPGTRLGAYEIVSQIGAGGMAEFSRVATHCRLPGGYRRHQN
jgi:hypothetical protein